MALLRTMVSVPRAINRTIWKCYATDCHQKRRIKHFRDLPGPKSLPAIGTLWKYVPRIGEYDFRRMHENGLKKYLKFGAMVKEEIVPGVPLLWLFDPSHIEELFHQEGKYPMRRSHLALEKYRMDRPETYNSAGLLPTNGPIWAKFRASVQKPLSTQRNIQVYIPQLDAVALDFVARTAVLNEEKQSRGPKDFVSELMKVFLEFIGVVTFDERLGSLDLNLSSSSRPLRLIKAADDINSSILRTDNGPQLWRKFETPLYKVVKNGLYYLEEVAKSFVEAKRDELKAKMESEQERREKTLLEIYLSQSDLDTKDLVTMIADMLLAGIDTTAFSTSFLLYHLARNPDKQNLLRAEIHHLLGNHRNALVSPSILAEAHYLKAVIKESLRLNPISIGIGRIVPQEAVIGGYTIPEGTVVVTQNQVSCRLPEFCESPDKFIPERWLQRSAKSSSQKRSHPFLVLPFGFGPRACIGRRLAEQNMQILLLRMLQEFWIEWPGGDMGCVSHLINQPDCPLQLIFKRCPTRE